jgi:hypothetical protein
MHQWLMPVILAILVDWDHETVAQGYPEPKQFTRLHLQNNQSKMGWR